MSYENGMGPMVEEHAKQSTLVAAAPCEKSEQPQTGGLKKKKLYKL